MFQSSKPAFHWGFLNTLLFKGEDHTRLLGHRVASLQDGFSGLFPQTHSVNGGREQLSVVGDNLQNRMDRLIITN